MKNVYIYPEWKNWENNYVEKLGKDKVVEFLEELDFYDIQENKYPEMMQSEKSAKFNFSMRSMRNMDNFVVRISDYEIELFARNSEKEDFKLKEFSGIKEMWRDYMSEQFSDYRHSLETYLQKKDKFYCPQYDRPMFR